MPATNKQVRAYRQRLRKRALKAVGIPPGGLCPVCHVRAAVEFAHLRATGLSGMGRGQYRRWLDVVRHPDCYQLRCRYCND
jgi:hypothetical protein